MAAINASERLGTTVAGKYRIERVLGAGGMGTVFGGVHAWTGRQVAVKMLNPDYAADASVVQRFLQEARAAARLDHPNVVDVLDMGQAEDGAVYLVLELMSGSPLTDLVAHGPMPVEVALRHLLPVIDALGVAHAHGIVHRDLKPDNIFLSRSLKGGVVPKLLDFGIAKVADKNTARTGTGFIVGTPSYMSPEQALGKSDLGPPSDVWSMGVVLFECLTGKLPFTAESSTGMLVVICTQPAPAVATRGVPVPASIAAVIDRALQSDPRARYIDAAEFGDALYAAACADGLDVPRPDPARPASERASLEAELPSAATMSQVSASSRGTSSATPPASGLAPVTTTPFTWASGEADEAPDLPKRRPSRGLLGVAGAVVVGAVAGTVFVVTSAGAAGGASSPDLESSPTAGPPVVSAASAPPAFLVPPAPPGALADAPDGGASGNVALPTPAAELPSAQGASRGEPSSASHGHRPRLEGSTGVVVAEPSSEAPPPPPTAPPAAREQPVVAPPSPQPPPERGANGARIID